MPTPDRLECQQNNLFSLLAQKPADGADMLVASSARSAWMPALPRTSNMTSNENCGGRVPARINGVAFQVGLGRVGHGGPAVHQTSGWDIRSAVKQLQAPPDRRLAATPGGNGAAAPAQPAAAGGAGIETLKRHGMAWANPKRSDATSALRCARLPVILPLRWVRGFPGIARSATEVFAWGRWRDTRRHPGTCSIKNSALPLPSDLRRARNTDNQFAPSAGGWRQIVAFDGATVDAWPKPSVRTAAETEGGTRDVGMQQARAI